MDDLAHTGISRIALEILAYLNKHPDAQDTIEGIAKWWLPEREICGETTAVKKAIRELITKDFVIEVIRSDGKYRYMLNKHKIDEVKSSLRRLKGEECT